MSEKRKVTMDDALAAGDGVLLTARRLRIEELEAQRDELLEALENMLKVYEGEGGTQYNAADIARAAIATAKGEE